MKRLLALAPLLCLALLPMTACDDDDAVTPEAFFVTVIVTDADGAPVPGLQMSVAADIPFYQDEKSRAAVAIPFSLAAPCSTRLIIEDVLGDPVMTWDEGPMVAGRHVFQWAGWDDDRVHQHSGVYFARIKCHDPDTGELLYDGRAPMYMALIDPARDPVLETDAQGRIVITDKRLFPHLCGVESMPARDETAEITGTITFGQSTRFGFHDPVAGRYMRFYRDVSGPGELEFVWDPGRSETSAAPAGARPAGKDDVLPPQAEFSVGPCYPNPFN